MQRSASVALLLALALSQTGCELFLPGIALARDINRAVQRAAEGEKTCAALGVLAAQPNARGITRLLNLASSSDLVFTEAQGEAVLELARFLYEEFCLGSECVDAAVASLDPPSDNALVEDWVAIHAVKLRAAVEVCPAGTALDETGLVHFVQLRNAIALAVEADR